MRRGFPEYFRYIAIRYKCRSLQTFSKETKTRGGRLADGDGKRLGLGVAGGVGDRERVRGGLSGRHVHAAGVGRPNGIGLRLKPDGFCIGHPVAELEEFPPPNFTGRGVKGLDGKLLAAHVLERRPVILALLFGTLLSGAVFKRAVLPPAGEKDRDNDERGDG